MIEKKRGLTITVAVALLLTMLPVALFSATAAAPQTADALVEGMSRVTLQDFKNFTIKQGETVHRWPYSPHNNYNDEQGVELLVDADGKGLYVANDKNKKGEAAFWVYIKEKSQFPAGQYLAVTLKKNSVKSSFEAALALGTSGFGFIVPAATDVYYDNGSGTLKIAAPVGGTDSRTYKAGTADTVTVYLPVDKFVRSDNASVGIAQTDLSDIQNLQLIFSDLGNKNDADVANEDAVSLREIALYTAAQLAYLDGVSMILPRNKDGNAMLAVQEIALYGENIQPEPGDEITLPAERVTLQDFKNVDTDKLLHWEEERDWKPVVENNELYLKGESGFFNLMVTDLMARNMEGMEYIAVTIRYKQATSLQIGLGLLFGGMSYGTGDNNGGQKSYYVDDGQRIREAKTPDVEMGNWVGPIVPAPISGDIVTLYLPLDQMRTYGSPIDKSLLTGVYLSSGWARSEGWIDESVENPPYLWALEDAFSVLKIEAVGSGFVREEKEVSVPADSKTLTDFTQQKDDLNYELDNAEAAVEPVVREGRLWFDDLMGRFAPDTYVIDTTNEKLSTYNFNGATYLAVNLSGQTERNTSYVTMALEDAYFRQFDFAGERVYVVAEDKLAQVRFNQGDIVTTVLRCANGETVTITMDTTLPRYYGRGLCIHGTQAYYNEWNDSLYLDGVHNQHDFEPKPLWGNAEEYEKEYQHPLWDKYAPTGGHGGMDWLVYSAFVDCVKRGIEPPVDVYDTATYMAVTALSEASIAIGGAPVAFPDFTEGRYLGREPMPETKYCLHKIFE